ncbi:hypothetical protein KGM_201580 [Danaus plexippus plexippus]|uniref:Uncharacterized protein n=1 Tax=Danaus plexippus plexippus TaxID=278856 RepID=A0A212FFH7_DANPL|nr:hypothetical protein KGM_201580 [Danaus plexippus plexippus]
MCDPTSTDSMSQRELSSGENFWQPSKDPQVRHQSRLRRLPNSTNSFISGVQVVDNTGEVSVVDNSGEVSVVDNSGEVSVVDNNGGGVSVVDNNGGGVSVVDNNDSGGVIVIDNSGGVNVNWN